MNWAFERIPGVCPCVHCQCDAVREWPLRLVRYRDTKRWWAPYGDMPGVDPCERVKGVDRERAHLFGPQHVSELRRNYLFEVVKPKKSALVAVQKRVRAILAAEESTS